MASNRYPVPGHTGRSAKYSKALYQEVAQVIAQAANKVVSNTAEAYHSPPERMRLTIAADLARMFAQDNPRFDTTRFLKACGADNGADNGCSA